MFGFRRYIRLLPRLILSLQGRQQSLSLGINPVDNAVPCDPHDNIIGSRLCDECVLSIDLNIFRNVESILCLLLQVCWQTIECLVSQIVRGTRNLRQFVSTLLIILPLIQVPLVWIDDYPCKVLKLYAAAPHFCLSVRNISQRIFEHVFPRMSWDHATVFAWGFFPTLVTHRSSRNTWFKLFFFCTPQ